MIKTIKKDLLIDYIYYATPFVICVVYLLAELDYSSLQFLVNSAYGNMLNIVFVAFGIVVIPNFCKLVYYHKKVLELPARISIASTTSERFGGAGEGKTSSAILQAVFEVL